MNALAVACSGGTSLLHSSRRLQLPLDPAHDVAEAGGASSVGHFRGLAGLAFAAVDYSPEVPAFLIADGVAVAPELGGYSLIVRVFYDARDLAVLYRAADFGSELEVEAHLVDAPAFVDFHDDAVLRVGDHVVVAPGAGHEREVGDARNRDVREAFGPVAAV